MPSSWRDKAILTLLSRAGQRIGLIRFGSRVDVYLPAGTGSQVLLGQRTIAGETIIGEIGSDPQRSGTSQ